VICAFSACQWRTKFSLALEMAANALSGVLSRRFGGQDFMGAVEKISIAE